LRELDQRADAVRVGQAAQGLPYSSNGAPVEPPRNNWDRLIRFPGWLSRITEVEKKETTENPRSTAAWSISALRPKNALNAHCRSGDRNRLWNSHRQTV